MGFEQTMPVLETKRSKPISMPARHLFVVITIIYRKVWAFLFRYHSWRIISGLECDSKLALAHEPHKISSQAKAEKTEAYTCMHFFIFKKKMPDGVRGC